MFDVHSPLLSLPGIFHTSLETIPAETPYFFAAPDAIEHWRGESSGLGGRKIGIVWHGDPRQENNRDRSIPLSCFRSLAGTAGVQLVSLRRSPARSSCKTCNFPSGTRAAASTISWTRPPRS